MRKLICKIFGHTHCRRVKVQKCEDYNANKNRKYFVVTSTYCNRCNRIIRAHKSVDMNAQSTVSYLLNLDNN